MWVEVEHLTCDLKFIEIFILPKKNVMWKLNMIMQKCSL